MSKSFQKRSFNGFTLIEMMIALAIFSSLIAVLMFGYAQGLSLWDKGRNQSGHWQSLEYKYGLLSSVFIQAQVATYERIGGIFVPHFQGEGQSLEMMTRAAVMDFPGNILPIRLTLSKRGNDDYELRYRQGRRFSDPMRGIKWLDDDVVLITGIKEGRFFYEAAAFPVPADLDPNYFDEGDKLRYRNQSEWLDTYNTHVMWLMPQKVSFHFKDSQFIDHQWTFPLPKSSDAWSLEVYSDD